MAIETVTVTIDGSSYPMTYNPSTQRWEAEVTAPGRTSWVESNHKYPVVFKATNSAQSSVAASSALRVLEIIKPTIVITSPSQGAYVANNKPTIAFRATDETGGSGIAVGTLKLTVDGTPVESASISSAAISGGYSFIYNPPEVLVDGPHTISVNISDNDGNEAAETISTFTVDTVPPSLNVTSPTDGYVSSTQGIEVSGTTNDETSSPVKVTVTVNGGEPQDIPVNPDGSFSGKVTLPEGESSEIVITVTDSAGQETTVTRYVSVNTSIPVITDIVIMPNPATTGELLTISCVVTEKDNPHPDVDRILENNSPETIQRIAKEGTGANYWSVGDKIGINLNGTVGALTFNDETYYAFIIGFNHNETIEGKGIHFQFGKTEDGTDIAFVDNRLRTQGDTDAFRMNLTNSTVGGWEQSYMRETICAQFYEALPAEWQKVIATCTKYTNNTGNGYDPRQDITPTQDKLWLLAEFEFFGERHSASIYERDYQMQYDYYKNGNGKHKYKHNNTDENCYWWLRSASRAEGCFVEVSGSYGDSASIGASTSEGFAPCFKVG